MPSESDPKVVHLMPDPVHGTAAMPLPCPFCGARQLKMVRNVPSQTRHRLRDSVPPSETQGGAVVYWNERRSSPAGEPFSGTGGVTAEPVCSGNS